MPVNVHTHFINDQNNLISNHHQRHQTSEHNKNEFIVYERIDVVDNTKARSNAQETELLF